MKCVTDKNYTGASNDLRRSAFSLSNELMTLADVDVLIDGVIYSMIEVRLNDDHKTFFDSVYKIDKSAFGVHGYNSVKSINWVAKSESQSRRVIIVTSSVSDYQLSRSDRIIIVTPSEFIEKTQKAQDLHERSVFSSLDDALVALFFFN
jgi:hypothetical protein